MNKVNPFPALTAPCPLISLSNLSNAGETTLVANLGKAALVKGRGRSIGSFFG